MGTDSLEISFKRSSHILYLANLSTSTTLSRRSPHGTIQASSTYLKLTISKAIFVINWG